MSLRDFRIVKFLGKGTYGTVYRVLRASDNQEYAMKEVNIRFMSQREREEAVNEIRLLASVRHPNIVSYCEAFVENDKLYLVTEFCGGGDLYEKLKRRKQRNQRFSEATLWGYLIQMCQGLKIMHDQNMLHRDLKCPNIFLSGDDIKIGDLGVAKLIKDDKNLARTQIGTPYYLSPEIWRNRAYDSKSDVWSLGVIMYELMCLRLPFEASTPDQLARKVVKGEYPPMPGSFSRELTALIAKMLVVDPLRRISVQDILSAAAVQSHMNTPQRHEAKAKTSAHHVDLYRTIRVPRKLSQLEFPSPKYPGATQRSGDSSSVNTSRARGSSGSGIGRANSNGDLVPARLPQIYEKENAAPLARKPSNVYVERNAPYQLNEPKVVLDNRYNRAAAYRAALQPVAQMPPPAPAPQQQAPPPPPPAMPKAPMPSAAPSHSNFGQPPQRRQYSNVAGARRPIWAYY